MKNCYHLCTAALKDVLLCYDEEDYRVLWNILVVCTFVSGIKMYCFCIMSNHLHLLISGSPQEIDRFMALFKQKTGRHYVQKYGKRTIQRLEYQLFPVNGWKSFCQETAYILRNPFKAGISSPFSYRWSPATSYFSADSEKGIPLREIPVKQRYALLKTRFELPGSVRLSDDGRILPGSFVDIPYVEKTFGDSSVQFFNQLRKWNLEELVNASHGEAESDMYSDEVVYREILQECQTVYRVTSPDRLDTRALVRLVRMVRSRFGAPQAQLRRLLPVDDDLLERIL